MGGVVRVVYLLRVAEITSGSSFEPYSPGFKETEMMALLKAVKAKNDIRKCCGWWEWADSDTKYSILAYAMMVLIRYAVLTCFDTCTCRTVRKVYAFTHSREISDATWW